MGPSSRDGVGVKPRLLATMMPDFANQEWLLNLKFLSSDGFYPFRVQRRKSGSRFDDERHELSGNCSLALVDSINILNDALAS